MQGFPVCAKKKQEDGTPSSCTILYGITGKTGTPFRCGIFLLPW